jgi:hypothetical protein
MVINSYVGFERMYGEDEEKISQLVFNNGFRFNQFLEIIFQ